MDEKNKGAKKITLERFTKNGDFCVKCGSKIPYDETGHKCELISCPPKKEEKKKDKN